MYPSQSINARDLKQLLAGKKTITADELAAGLNLDMVGAGPERAELAEISADWIPCPRSAAGLDDTIYVSFCDGEQTAAGSERAKVEVQERGRSGKLVTKKVWKAVRTPPRLCVFEVRFGADLHAAVARFVPLP